MSVSYSFLPIQATELSGLFLFQSIKEVELSKLGSLDFLDLSRNLIVELSPGTFAGMTNLKGLDFSVNVVRKVIKTLATFFIKYKKSLRFVLPFDFQC